VRSLSCAEQFRALAFAQLTYRESLRDIETCLLANQTRLYGMRFCALVKRSRLAGANEGRSGASEKIWRCCSSIALANCIATRFLPPICPT
jgi:hypothetical protein